MNLSDNLMGLTSLDILKRKFQRAKDPSSCIGWFSISGFAPQWDSVGKSGRLLIWSEVSWHNS